ncbi:MAG: ankyrin repeat domain-containing protein [Methylibium sp.]|uniref:ankyrin repeat domain-containing protein n=1 Tax=Methylibium sp. TaxID=2067992 RepID=UPI001818B9B6|nr:ankyrin repeat domain-containing protein [Methylibium sp.]MBA3596564.1 ankyrin repeat domain-containing protein [Methylibium sp.]
MKYIAYLAVELGFSSSLAGSYEDFFRAVHGNDAAAVEALVARGFDPNAPDPRGQPALMRALDAGASDVALTIARLPGTDVNVQNPDGETPLMKAAMKGNIALCRALIERGADVNRPGWTPLHYAAAGDSLPALRLLLAEGAAVDARAPNGRTPLMMAALYADERLVETLLAAGADLGARERDGATAADLAGAGGREWLARKLAERADGSTTGR